MKQCQEIKPNWIWSENFDISFCVIFYHLAKKKLSCFRKSTGRKFFHHLHDRIVECMSEYIFFVSNKKTYTETTSKRN